VPPHLRVRWPKSFAQWRTVFGRAWSEYKLTWNGFFSSRGFLVEDEPKDGAHDEAAAAARDTLKQVGRDVRERVTRNAQLVKDEAETLRTRVRDATGIHSKEDLRKWVGEVMQLFSDCVKEFMAGYRKGRDGEVEKMLTEYFQELERSASTSPRRRRKRKRREIQFI
jgi:gas vesicle protein